MDLHKRIMHIEENMSIDRKVILIGELESLKEQYNKMIQMNKNILEKDEPKYFTDFNRFLNKCLTTIEFALINPNFNIITDLDRINKMKIRGYYNNILFYVYSHILIELGSMTRENTHIELVDHSVLNKDYNCYFCNKSTQTWNEKTKTPICKSCGDSENSNLYVEDIIIKHL